jgi:hypothetical protein
MIDMEIKTPQGLLKAELIHEPNYPGIKISLNGEIVAIVEHALDKGVQTCAYNSVDEEPEITKYIKGCD